MKSISLFFSKNYWKYIFSLKKTLTILLNTLGVIWLLVEPLSFFSQDLADFFKLHWLWLFGIGVIWAIYECWPQTEFCNKIANRDIHIQISIGDLFKYEGDLIIPINTSFDTSFEDGLIAINSTQGQFTKKYFNEPRYLEQDIQVHLNNQAPILELPTKLKGNKFRYEIGKVLKLKLPKEENKFAYISAIADMNDSGVAATNFDNILVSLGSLWEFVMHKGEFGTLNIPVFGTGRGRVMESRETIIKAIIHSFISSISSGRRFCNKLNIVIYPKDFADNKINIKELCDFLRLKCEHYEHDSNSNTIPKGQGIV